jgi:PTH1 family peptidyl-tRNA hydrolase
VVVGLGNPGDEYGRTRHNLGWLALEAAARVFGAGNFRRERQVEAAEAFWSGEKVYLLRPMAYMNRSGQALASWLGSFREVRDEIRRRGVTPSEGAAGAAGKIDKAEAGEAECLWPGLLILADDVNLPLGRLRLRPSGSAGGHTGLLDVEKALGGQGYPRLRLGVGAPPGRVDRADYVLGRFSREEMPAALRAADRAAAAVGDWIALGLDAARDAHNGPDPGAAGG